MSSDSCNNTERDERARFFSDPSQDDLEHPGPWVWVIDRAAHPSADPLDLVTEKLNARIEDEEGASIGHEATGRPVVVGDGDESLEFSISRCAGAFAVAIAWRGRIGVDIQSPAEVKDLESLSREMLCPSEREMLAKAGEAERKELFCRMWTIKEAYMKASGTGMLAHPPGIETAPDPADGRRAKLVSLVGIASLARGWRVSQRVVETAGGRIVVGMVWG